jgi:hypothetical protein
MAARQARYPLRLLAALAVSHSKTGLAWRKPHDFKSRVIQTRPQPIINRVLQ